METVHAAGAELPLPRAGPAGVLPALGKDPRPAQDASTAARTAEHLAAGLLCRFAARADLRATQDHHLLGAK